MNIKFLKTLIGIFGAFFLAGLAWLALDAYYQPARSAVSPPAAVEEKKKAIIKKEKPVKNVSELNLQNDSTTTVENSLPAPANVAKDDDKSREIEIKLPDDAIVSIKELRQSGDDSAKKSLTAVLSDYIEISKIGIKLPLVATDQTDAEKLHNLLDSGAILYPGSAGFGNSGLTVVLGHSAPPNWPDIKYDHAFSKINSLTSGDKVAVSYKGNDYYYMVIGQQIILKGEDISIKEPEKSTLALMTCWPPGRDQKRLIVETVLAD